MEGVASRQFLQNYNLKRCLPTTSIRRGGRTVRLPNYCRPFPKCCPTTREPRNGTLCWNYTREISKYLRQDFSSTLKIDVYLCCRRVLVMRASNESLKFHSFLTLKSCKSKNMFSLRRSILRSASNPTNLHVEAIKLIAYCAKDQQRLCCSIIGCLCLRRS